MEVDRHHNAPWFYIHRKLLKTLLAFQDIKGVFDSNSRDISQASKTHELGDILAIKWAHVQRHKNHSHANRRNSGGVCSQGLPAVGHFINPAVLHGCRRSQRGSRWEWKLHTGVCAMLIIRKFPHTISELLQEVLGMEQQWCDRNQLSIHPQKFQDLDQDFRKPGH